MVERRRRNAVTRREERGRKKPVPLAFDPTKVDAGSYALVGDDPGESVTPFVAPRREREIPASEAPTVLVMGDDGDVEPDVVDSAPAGTEDNDQHVVVDPALAQALARVDATPVVKDPEDAETATTESNGMRAQAASTEKMPPRSAPAPVELSPAVPAVPATVVAPESAAARSPEPVLPEPTVELEPAAPRMPEPPESGADAVDHESFPAAAQRGLDVVGATTERRTKPWRRFAAWATVIGAVVAGVVAGIAHFDRSNKDDGDTKPEPAALMDPAAFEAAKAVMADTTIQPPAPVYTVTEGAPSTPETETVSAVIGRGEGVSQALGHMGMDSAHMQHALDLQIQIGDQTVKLGDTFVQAKGGELTLTADWNGDQVTGVHFSAAGHDLSPRELSQFLRVAGPAETVHHDTFAHMETIQQILADADAQLDAVLSTPTTRPDTALPAAGQYLGERPATSPLHGADLELPSISPATVHTVETSSYDIPATLSPRSVERVSVDPDAPTELVQPRPTEVQVEEMPSEAVEKHLDYTSQMRALDGLLATEKGHTVRIASNHLEFRKRGGHYEVRYIQSREFEELTPEMLQRLEAVAYLDFERPLMAMPLTQEEYASVLPDGNIYKERIRQSLQIQLDMAKQIGMHNLVAEKNMAILNGQTNVAEKSTADGQASAGT